MEMFLDRYEKVKKKEGKRIASVDDLYNQLSQTLDCSEYDSICGHVPEFSVTADPLKWVGRIPMISCGAELAHGYTGFWTPMWYNSLNSTVSSFFKNKYSSKRASTLMAEAPLHLHHTSSYTFGQ